MCSSDLTLRPNIRAAMWTAFGSGARVSEVAKLTRGDVSLRGGAVYIAIHDAKWGSDRTIPVIDDKAARILYAYWQNQPISTQPLFRVSSRTLQEYMTHYSEETGVHVWMHLLRHTFAARLLEQNVPMTQIQYLLGHRTLEMTAHYTESALVDTSYLAPSIFQKRGTSGTEPPKSPTLRPL